MATTLSVSGLTSFIDEKRDELFVKSVAGAKTLDYVEIYPGVKYKTALNYLDSTVVLADGSNCGWNPQGSDVFSERMLEVHPITVQKEYCWKSMREKFMNWDLAFQAGRENLPFMEKIANANVDAVKVAVDELLWQGNSGLSISGYTDLISAETSAVKVEFATGATVVAKIDAVVAAIPVAALRKGVNIFLSYTDFRNYIAELNSTCCASRPIIDAAVDSLTYLGDSRIKLVPVIGLEGTGKIVAASVDALVAGMDLTKDSPEAYKWFYLDKEDTFNFKILFELGTQIKWPNEVVLGA